MRSFFPKKEKAGFTLGKPGLTVTRSFAKCKSDLRKTGVPYKNYFKGGRRIIFRGKLPGYDEEIWVCVNAILNRITYIELYRTEEYAISVDRDIFRSFREFSSALENLYGEPQIRQTDVDGGFDERWETPCRIWHYIMERFGWEEHLKIYF